jgi:hypothetical protein
MPDPRYDLSGTLTTDSNPYFNGGYNTVEHGSRDSGTVSGVQIESNYTGVRDTSTSRAAFGTELADALDVFFSTHFTMDLANGAPTISQIPDTGAGGGITTGPIPFTVNDTETSADQLSLTVTSSDTAVLPLANIQLGGSGSNRTITLTPTNLSGDVTVTLTVTDSAGAKEKSSFILSVNGAPVLAPVASRHVNAGTLVAFQEGISNMAADEVPTFSMAPGAPAGATIDAASGVFSWTPTNAQAGATYQFTIAASDSGNPPQSSSTSFNITVDPAPALSASWTQYRTAPNTQSAIPNCSYAGYKYGSVALPSPQTNIINVRNAPYNAAGNGIADDTTAIRNAIAAATTSGGVVYFPDGTYLCSGVLFVPGNNTVLRGQSRLGTKIKFIKSLNTCYGTNDASGTSRWGGSGGLIWFTPSSKNTYRPTVTEIGSTYSESWPFGNVVTTITTSAVRGATTVKVNNSNGLSAGQFLSLRLDNVADATTLKMLCGGGTWATNYDWSATNSGAILPPNKTLLDWVVEIASISGKTLTLKQPLRYDLPLNLNPRVVPLGDTVRESGIENLTIVLARDYTWTAAAWHNNEPGWNGVFFNNAINCFLRSVSIVDSDVGLAVTASKNITATDFSVESSGPATLEHHQATTCRVGSQDCLYENFAITSKPYHGIEVDNFSMGNVWSKGTLSHGTFDMQRRVPYENIHTEITLNNTGTDGGSTSYGPFMGARFVNWNVAVSNGINSNVGEANLMPNGAIVGVRGISVANPVDPVYGDSKCVVELSGAAGAVPNPVNLYRSQLALRLNTPPTISLASPTVGATTVAPGSFTLSPTISDLTGAVTSVRYYRNGTLVGTSTVSPYTFVYSGLAAGDYTLTTALTDDLGATATSSGVLVHVKADTDGDGMPDDWETANSFNPASATDGVQDTDGDGTTNLQEFRAGTDPRSSASVFRVTSIVRNGVDFVVSFNSVSGKQYRVEKCASLTNPQWTPVADNVPGTGGTIAITDSGAVANGTAQFYRVVLL